MMLGGDPQPNSVVLGAEAIASLFRRDAKPVLFLGAGASVKSGIPLAGASVDAIARFAYCRIHDKSPDDPTIMRSDWIRWLEQQPWFRLDLPRAALYPLAVEHLLRPQSNRKDFFQRILKPDIPPSDGYMRLAALLSRRAIRTVLTTNFDDLVVRTAKQTPAIRHVEEIMTESDHTLFKIDPPHPQVVYLHGSVNHYSDRNLIKETQELDPQLVALLQPLLRDHPLIVVGYRGAEPSIMKHLLIDQSARCGRFREGIYWCHRPDSPPQESPLISELAATVGSNLQFVQIDGFDELMVVVERSVHVSENDSWGARPEAVASHTSIAVHDLQASSLALEDLNAPLLRTKLLEYAEGMRLPKPSLGTTEQLWTAMLAQNLGTTAENSRRATRGGQLLFAQNARKQIPAARIVVTITGPKEWVDSVLDQQVPTESVGVTATETLALEGDLWAQLEQGTDLLSRVNRPFRMKGAISQTAYPYPPLALKELLTNFLAHRDYRIDEPGALAISLGEIRFENPGGLVDSVRRQLDDEPIQQAIGEGTRRLKGYRNPVVADFFFSAGAMDKEGSGLPDVVQEATNNLNSVSFGPTQDNTKFVALIQCRPEALLIDRDTKTARRQRAELRYSPNFLQIVAWPEQVAKLGTLATPRELAKLNGGSIAPFGSHREWIWTFANLEHESARPLIELGLEEEQHSLPTMELLNSRDAAAVLPRLLNMALGQYLTGLGLQVWIEAGRLRAYYPSNEDAAREISYKSTFRQSKRTVSKPIISRTTGKVVYWEHKAVSLRFERFQSNWVLTLLPGYVFTIDGKAQPIASERIGPLSTRRSARDYNATVFHDLVFWCRMLSNGSEEPFHVPVSAERRSPAIGLSTMIPTFVFDDAIDSGVSSAAEVTELSDAELDSLQDQIEEVIASSDAPDDLDEAANR